MQGRCRNLSEKHQAKHFPSRGILNTWKIERLNTGNVNLREELIQGFFFVALFSCVGFGVGKANRKQAASVSNSD